MGKFSIAGVIILFVIAILIVGPLLTIWSLNLIFGMTIEYGFTEWVAVMWLSALVWGGTSSKKK